MLRSSSQLLRLLGVTVGLWALAAFSQATEAAAARLAEGEAAFRTGNYAEAQKAFTTIIEQDQQLSLPLFYNLGNTAFRMKELGQAALWYRRALVLDPADGPTRQNLRVIGKDLTGFLEFPSSTSQWLAGWLSPTAWKACLSGASWAAAIAIASLLFLHPRGRLRSALLIVWPLCALAIIPAFWGLRVRTASNRILQTSVVTTGTVALAAPTNSAGEITDLPPGSEVIVGESKDGWSFIETAGGRFGWVKEPVLTPLWPYSPALIR
jgi:Tetratricopeptide repeat